MIQARSGSLVTAHGDDVQKKATGVPGNALVSMAGPERPASTIEVSSIRLGRCQPSPSSVRPSQ
jgi:hypothetical protein